MWSVPRPIAITNVPIYASLPNVYIIPVPPWYLFSCASTDANYISVASLTPPPSKTHQTRSSFDQMLMFLCRCSLPLLYNPFIPHYHCQCRPIARTYLYVCLLPPLPSSFKTLHFLFCTTIHTLFQIACLHHISGIPSHLPSFYILHHPTSTTCLCLLPSSISSWYLCHPPSPSSRHLACNIVCSDLPRRYAISCL